MGLPLQTCVAYVGRPSYGKWRMVHIFNINNTADHVWLPHSTDGPEIWNIHQASAFQGLLNSTLLLNPVMGCVFNFTDHGSRRPLSMPVGDYLDYINRSTVRCAILRLRSWT